MPLVILIGDAKVLKDEHVKGICEKKKVNRMKVSLEEKEAAFNLLSQGGLFFNNVLLDIVDFDDWKKDDQKRILEIAEKAKIDVIVRTEESIKAKDVLVLALPKPWEHEKWAEYVSERLKKHGISASRRVAELIFEKVGPNDELIEREIEKLACVTNQPTEELVEQIVSLHSRGDIEELCFKVSMGNFEEAHQLLSTILKNTEAVVVVSALARHFLDLYKLVLFLERQESYPWPAIKKASESLGVGLGKTAKFLGFSFKGGEKVLNHIMLYDAEKLEKILDGLYWLDLAVKSIPTPNLAIHNFLDQVRQILGEGT
ncbi:DNA polymerase III subunit delta [Pseudothermotoga sp.]